MTAPLQYLSGAGGKAAPVVALTWGVLVISIVVDRHHHGRCWPPRSGASGPPWLRRDVLPDAGGANWLWIGVSVSALALLVTVIWTVMCWPTSRRRPRRPPSPSKSPASSSGGRRATWRWRASSFTTANEFHIPVGVPVRLKLIGGDVIHSFWVPALAGKMDAIPGQVNETWIEAARPGTYIGQCTEYCGVQHSQMLLRVIAEPRRSSMPGGRTS